MLGQSKMADALRNVYILGHHHTRCNVTAFPPPPPMPTLPTLPQCLYTSFYFPNYVQLFPFPSLPLLSLPSPSPLIPNLCRLYFYFPINPQPFPTVLHLFPILLFPFSSLLSSFPAFPSPLSSPSFPTLPQPFFTPSLRPVSSPFPFLPKYFPFLGSSLSLPFLPFLFLP